MALFFFSLILYYIIHLFINLFQVLCELQMAMLERGIEVEDDVERSIMGKDVRNTEDSSYRNLRDW